MALFKISKKLERIAEHPFKLEKEMQNLTEQNIQTVFNLNLVKSEFSIKNFRIDTLAYDSQSNSFVIIEYKKDKNFSIVDQGVAYLASMLDNKADFILEYNERNASNPLTRTSVDWSQSRVIFISPAFTQYQKEAINFKDLSIELWEIKRFSNGTVSYEQIQKGRSQESIKTISKGGASMDTVAKEIKVYTEKSHIEKSNDEIVTLYRKFRDAILNLGDNVTIKPNKLYLSFIANTNIADIEMQKNGIKICINMKKGELDDPKNLSRDISSIGTLGNGDYEVKVNSDENLEYILSLIKQSFIKHGGR